MQLWRIIDFYIHNISQQLYLNLDKKTRLRRVLYGWHCLYIYIYSNIWITLHTAISIPANWCSQVVNYITEYSGLSLVYVFQMSCQFKVINGQYNQSSDTRYSVWVIPEPNLVEHMLCNRDYVIYISPLTCFHSQWELEEEDHIYIMLNWVMLSVIAGRCS